MNDAMKWLIRAKEYMEDVWISSGSKAQANIINGLLFVCDTCDKQVNIFSKENGDWERQITSQHGIIKETPMSGVAWKKHLRDLAHGPLIKKLIGD